MSVVYAFKDDGGYIEIIPSSKEEGRKLEQELKKIDPSTVVTNFSEFGGEMEVWRVKQFLRKHDGTLLSVGKEALIVIQRRTVDGKLELSRVSVRSIAQSYELIPHSEVVKDIENLVKKAGYTPKTYIQRVGVNFRSLSLLNKTVTIENEEYELALVANNSYNYSSALRVHMYLVRKGHVYPLLSDVLYRKHRVGEVTTEEFETSLKFTQKVIEALPLLKGIKVNTYDTLAALGTEKIEVRYWRRDKDGKKKPVLIPVGRNVANKVISKVGRRADVLTLWKTLSEVVFAGKKDHIPGLNLRVKRRFEKVIFQLLENYLRSLEVL